MQHEYAIRYAELYRKHWWWRSRESAVVQTIRRLTDLPAGARILDVGCGDALSLPMLSSLAPDAEAWGIEIDEHTILPDNPLRDRIYNKPLGDAMYRGMTFDLITTLDVVEHIEDDDAAIDDMMRMLNPGGWLVLTVPAGPSLWTAHDELNLHFRRYTRGGLTSLLERHGELLDCRHLYNALALPKVLLAAMHRFRPAKPSPPKSPGGPVNRILQAYCTAESTLAQKVRVPFGSSLIAVVRKPISLAMPKPQATESPLSAAA
ncbi:MAG: methyltransferase domain-containing protein [Planctomycetota bacterium]